MLVVLFGCLVLICCAFVMQLGGLLASLFNCLIRDVAFGAETDVRRAVMGESGWQGLGVLPFGSAFIAFLFGRMLEGDRSSTLRNLT